MALILRACAPFFQVFDMPQSGDFYCRVLGFTLENHSPIIKSPLGDYLTLRCISMQRTRMPCSIMSARLARAWLSNPSSRGMG